MASEKAVTSAYLGIALCVPCHGLVRAFFAVFFRMSGIIQNLFRSNFLRKTIGTKH